MEISSQFSSIFGVEQNTESERIRRKQRSDQDETDSGRGKTDTVSISDEARRLSELFYQRTVKNFYGGQAGTEEEESDAAEAVTGNAGASENKSSSEVEKIKKRIEKLQQQIDETASSEEMSDDAKQSRIAALDTEIQHWTEELAEAQMRDKAKKAGGK